MPAHAVDLERLDVKGILVATDGGDPKPLAPTQVDAQVGEPGIADEEEGLAGHGIEADHVPEKLRLHGAGIAVAGEAVGRGAEVGLCNVAAAQDGEVLAVDEVVEVGRGEAGLVGRVEDGVAEPGVSAVDAGPEGGLEALDKGVGPAAEADEVGKIVMGVEGILPGQALVVQVAPVAAAARQGVLGDEAAGVTGPDEAGEAEGLHVRVPVVATVARARQVGGQVGAAAEPGGDDGQGEVVGGAAQGARQPGQPGPGRLGGAAPRGLTIRRRGSRSGRSAA